MTDPTRARVEREFKHASPLVGGRFDPSGRFLFVSAQDSTVQRFDLLTGARVSLTGHQGWVRGIACIPQGNTGAVEVAAWERAAAGIPAVAGAGVMPRPPKPRPFALVTGDYHGKLIWWDGAADEPRPVRTVEAHDGWVRAVAASPHGQTIATCGNDGRVRLWAADGAPLRTFEGHGCHVYNVAFHPTGARLASADLKGVVKDWDVRTGACARDLDAKLLHKYDPTFMADIGGARGMAFAADGTRLACCGITNVSNAFAGVGNPVVVVFDWATGKATQLKPKDAFQGTAWGVTFHPAGYVIAAGGGGGGRVWVWKDGETASAQALTVPANVRDLAPHPAGERFAVCAANGTAYVYTTRPELAPAVVAAAPARTPGK